MNAASLANRLWRRIARKALADFEHALRQPLRAQERVFKRQLALLCNSTRGKYLGLHANMTPGEFSANIPVTSYSHLKPWIDQLMAGERNVLTTSAIDRLIPSSGSTSAIKWIPYTAELRREFQLAIQPWVADLFRQQPELLNGPAFWSISPAQKVVSPPSAIPTGYEDDTRYLSTLGRWAMGQVQAVPGSVRQIEDADQFRFVTLLFLLRNPDLRIVSVWHPTYLELLFRDLEVRKDELLGAVHDGFDHPSLSKAARRWLIRGDRRRAAHLRVSIWQRPNSLWPQLSHISAWGDGPAEGPFNRLRQRVNPIPVMRKGLLATEAVISIPFIQTHPLAINSHYLEFMDESGQTTDLTELTCDREYEVLVTTAGGLIRHRMYDRIRVTGFLAATPTIEFVGKLDHLSDICGEKLHESFVCAVIQKLMRQHQLCPNLTLLAPNLDVPPHYVLYLSDLQLIPESFPNDLDQALCQNPHYDYARRLGQLGPARLQTVPAELLDSMSMDQSGGAPMGHIKPRVLSAKEIKIPQTGDQATTNLGLASRVKTPS